jgi:hypothetical protein
MSKRPISENITDGTWLSPRNFEVDHQFFGSSIARMSPDKAASNGVEHVVGAATKLRRFLEQSNKILPCPGVYDGFSARIALQVGFDALYMASSPSPSQFSC